MKTSHAIKMAIESLESESYSENWTQNHEAIDKLEKLKRYWEVVYEGVKNEN